MDALDPKLQAIGTKMKGKFDKCFESFDIVNMMLVIVVALDPTKKLHCVNHLYEKIYDNESKINEMHYKVKGAFICINLMSNLLLFRVIEILVSKV